MERPKSSAKISQLSLILQGPQTQGPGRDVALSRLTRSRKVNPRTILGHAHWPFEPTEGAAFLTCRLRRLLAFWGPQNGVYNTALLERGRMRVT